MNLRKHRAASKYPHHKHSYGKNRVKAAFSHGDSLVAKNGTPVQSKAWAGASDSVKNTIILIDSVKDRRNARSVYDENAHVIGVLSGEEGRDCPNVRCANCGSKSVRWAHAVTLLARIEVRGTPVPFLERLLRTCGRITSDAHVRQCWECNNWEHFVGPKATSVYLHATTGEDIDRRMTSLESQGIPVTKGTLQLTAFQVVWVGKPLEFRVKRF